MEHDRRLNRPSRTSLIAFSAIPVLVIVVFVLLPLGNLAVTAFSPTALRATLTEKRTWSVLGATFLQATVSTLCTVAIGIVPGLSLARHNFRGRSTVLGLLAAIFVLPTVAMAAGVNMLLPGDSRGLLAIVIAHTIFNLAVIVRSLAATPIPSPLERAARTLGASPVHVFRTVTLPLIRSTLTSACLIVFTLCFTSFGVVRILGTTRATTLEVEIWREAIMLGRIDRGLVLALLQVATIGLAITVVRRHRTAHFDTSPRTPATPMARLAIVVLCGALASPIVALALGSIRANGHYTLSAWARLFDTTVRPGLSLGVNPRNALITSLLVALVATTMTSIITGSGVLSTALLRRVGFIVNGLSLLPLGISAVTIGLGLLITFDHAPFDWRANWMLIPLGHALIATPFALRPAMAALRTLNPQRTSAAQLLGAPPLRAHITAIRSVAAAPLLTGIGLATAISLGEFGATSMLSRSGAETLPVVIEKLLGRTGGDFYARGHALALLLSLATMGAVFIMDRWAERVRR